MVRRFLPCGLVVAIVSANAASSRAAPPVGPPPLTYELMINGESFLVEGDRAVKLESKEKPGTSYKVALRVAPTQRIRLNSIQFEYDLPAKAEDDGKRENRSVRIAHELGFTMLINDLGQPMDAKAREETLKILLGSVKETLRDMKEDKIDISEPHQRKFADSSALGATVRYRDAHDIGHVCLAYVLTGPTFGATCVVQYLDDDGDDVLPLIKKTLDSIQAREKG